jgi:hypothetical protein
MRWTALLWNRASGRVARSPHHVPDLQPDPSRPTRWYAVSDQAKNFMEVYDSRAGMEAYMAGSSRACFIVFAEKVQAFEYPHQVRAQ